jgi:phosphoglycolate phosphatase
MIKLIIFDYDGVIVDSFRTIYEIYKVICKELNKTCPKTINEFREIYGKTFLDLYKNLEILTSEEKEKAERVYKKELLKKEPKMFAGINDVIKILSKNYKLVIISSNYKEEVEQKLKKFDILSYFSNVIGKMDDAPTNLRKTEEIVKIVKKFGLTNKEVIMIGDRVIDYLEAKEAGLTNIILASYGWDGKEKLKEYTKLIIHSPKEIINKVKELEEVS